MPSSVKRLTACLFVCLFVCLFTDGTQEQNPPEVGPARNSSPTVGLQRDAKRSGEGRRRGVQEKG